MAAHPVPIHRVHSNICDILIHALWGACQVRFWNVFGLYISVDGADALGLALGDRGVYEHLLGLNVLLAGANGLRSASEASAKQTMSGGGCSRSVCLITVLTNTG